MHEVLKNKFPYSMHDYDSRFINRKVIAHIRDFCESNPVIEKFYAKGSIIHGCMVEGSDIDHVRIKVNQKLALPEKIELVDLLEKSLQELGVTGLKRVREDGYIRVFSNWYDLIDIPNAYSKKFELYPKLKIITAKDSKDWFKKVVKTGYLYTGKVPQEWIDKMRERVLR